FNGLGKILPTRLPSFGVILPTLNPILFADAPRGARRRLAPLARSAADTPRGCAPSDRSCGRSQRRFQGSSNRLPPTVRPRDVVNPYTAARMAIQQDRGGGQTRAGNCLRGKAG